MSAPRARDAKNALFDALARVGQALGNGRRAEIVELLSQAERTVEEIANEIDQSVANTSHHLRALADAGLVERRRSGRHIIYRLADPVHDLWTALREVAAVRVAEVPEAARRYLGDRARVPTMPAVELRNRLGRDDLTVIDVRPEIEYAAGHIIGALSVPPGTVAGRIDELTARAEVVAYCRGPFCRYADDAVRTLARRGVAAHRLADGLPEWRRRYPDLVVQGNGVRNLLGHPGTGDPYRQSQ